MEGYNGGVADPRPVSLVKFDITSSLKQKMSALKTVKDSAKGDCELPTL